jgi:predicted nucleotidyltransferase component of viral defense system
LSQKASDHAVKVVKDADTVQRIKSHYRGLTGDRLLKIETSFRSPPDEAHVAVIDGIRTYTLAALIGQKIDALANRTAARDLYDVAFLARHHLPAFSPAAKQRLAAMMQDVDALEHRFEDAFEEDEILREADLAALIVQLSDALSS